MQKGKFSAAAIDVFVRTLKNVDFPTFGKPTIPHFKLVLSRPIIAGRSSEEELVRLFGGIMKSLDKLMGKLYEGIHYFLFFGTVTTLIRSSSPVLVSLKFKVKQLVFLDPKLNTEMKDNLVNVIMCIPAILYFYLLKSASCICFNNADSSFHIK